MSNYYFISDIHLGLESREKEQIKESKLIALLDEIKKNGRELFICGDLFDYWFEYRSVYQKGYFRTLTGIYNLVQSGVKVHYFIGNHDFMHRDFFTKEIGVILHSSDKTVTIEGKKFFIAHGDGLMKNDYGYRFIKSILRNRFIQELYSFIHPDVGIKLASVTSKKSRKYTNKKDFGDKDALAEVASEIIRSGYDYVVLGHRHKRKIEQFGNGFYINLGTWLEKPVYGLFNSESFTINEWN